MDENSLQELKSLALQERTIVNFILSESARVSFVNISLDVPEDTGCDDPIEFATETKAPPIPRDLAPTPISKNAAEVVATLFCPSKKVRLINKR